MPHIPPSNPEDTAAYRSEVLTRLRAIDSVQREIIEHGHRIDRTERDIIQMKQVLFGDPSVKQLRDGDRGGLVDLFREMQRQLKGYAKLRMLMVVLLATSVAQLFKDIPAGAFKLLLGVFK